MSNSTRSGQYAARAKAPASVFFQAGLPIGGSALAMVLMLVISHFM